jgi:signal transduction histidine kinase
MSELYAEPTLGKGDVVNILLVDDQPGKLLSYEVILQELGQNLIKVASAREALEQLLKNDIAVVLIDVCMPELDGFELASLIREHPRCRRTAIILISAVLMTDLDRIKGYVSGAVDYVSVPIVPEVLRAKVNVFVDLYRKTHALERLNQELERRVAERTRDLEESNSRLHQASELLREADRRKDEFLATLAHELRNPLAPIRNSVAIMRKIDPFDANLKWCRDVVDRQVNHLTRLVDDLLDVSRITRDKIELRRERVDLSEIVSAAIEATRSVVEENGLELQATRPEAPMSIIADRVRLTQCLINLLNNAAKFTPRGGHVRLDVECGGAAQARDGCANADEIVVRVQDDGIGMEPDKLARVFEIFFQVDSSLERPEGGLGIGLTLVRRLVELHGGTVEAHSAGPGKGSEFILRLPIVVPALDAQLLPPDAGGSRTGETVTGTPATIPPSSRVGPAS